MKACHDIGQHRGEPIRMMRSGGQRAFEPNLFVPDPERIVVDRDLAALADQSHRVPALIRAPGQKNPGAATGKMKRQGGFIFDPGLRAA